MGTTVVIVCKAGLVEFARVVVFWAVAVGSVKLPVTVVVVT